MNYFVTAIDTDSGKTLASAILCEALQADYWKPVQAGFPRDSEVVAGLVSNGTTTVHPETYLLTTPASPHAAAKIDGVSIEIEKFRVPPSKNLVIEGAGGILVPLNDSHFIVDLISHFDASIVLVSDLYLGSINHTLLTVEAIRRRNLPLKGIIFNGGLNTESQRIILHHAGVPELLHITKENTITRQTIRKYADELLVKNPWLVS